MPESDKVWGLVLASSVTVRVPVNVPVVVGVNVMLTTQLALAARGVAQLVAVKGPLVLTLEMFKGTD